MTSAQHDLDNASGHWIERDVPVPAGLAELSDSAVGTPFTLAVKANIAVAGYRLNAGSPVLGTRAAEVDAPVVSTLRQHGASVVGTTNMHELALGVTSNNAHFGPVRNPVDVSRSAGGSSGGSAAVVAVGEADAALGTDTGGSISIPAALCGVVGFRPSTGRWPTAGTVPLSWTRDSVGSLTRDVATAAQFDRWITGIAGIDHLRDNEIPRLGLPATLWEDLSPETRAASDRAIARLASVVELVEVDPSDVLSEIEVAAQPILLWESRRTLAASAAEALGMAPEDAFRKLVDGTASPDVKRALEMVLADPISSTTYAESTRLVESAREQYLAAQQLAMLDGWLFPTTPIPAPLLEQSDEFTHFDTRWSTGELLMRNIRGIMLGVPMVTIPLPIDAGLPVGLTVQGQRGRDRRALEIAARIEAALR